MLIGLALPALAGAWEPDALAPGVDGPVTADQWGLAAIGLDAETVRSLHEADALPVVVAVIDSGVMPSHPDLPRDRFWINAAEPVNGVDDDGNGYIDDRYGWDFVDDDNDPNDELGHGTHVAGIIGAAAGNGQGISGIAPAVRLMPLRALNRIGRGYSSRVAEAVYYAVRMKADIINLSMAVEDLSAHEARAVAYAVDAGALVVAASGNDASDAGRFTPAAIGGVLTVAATDREGARAGFSNFGTPVDLSAPGVDITSLRPPRLNFVETITGVPLTPEQAVVTLLGPGRDYIVASGTSFAAPFVSGAAALAKSLNPELGGAALARMLKNSAVDIGTEGIDHNTGYGLLNVPALLEADPEYFIDCRIDGVSVVAEGGAPAIEVLGSADSDQFDGAELRLGLGDSPASFGEPVMVIETATRDESLGRFPAAPLAGGPLWTLRLEVRHRNGSQRSCRYQLSLG